VTLLSGGDQGETRVEGVWLKLPLKVRKGFEAMAIVLAELKQPLQKTLFDCKAV
jgi:hypothetical protein